MMGGDNIKSPGVVMSDWFEEAYWTGLSNDAVQYRKNLLDIEQIEKLEGVKCRRFVAASNYSIGLVFDRTLYALYIERDIAHVLKENGCEEIMQEGHKLSIYGYAKANGLTYIEFGEHPTPEYNHTSFYPTYDVGENSVLQQYLQEINAKDFTHLQEMGKELEKVVVDRKWALEVESVVIDDEGAIALLCNGAMKVVVKEIFAYEECANRRFKGRLGCKLAPYYKGAELLYGVRAIPFKNPLPKAGILEEIRAGRRDLHGENLYGLDLSGLDLTGADLSNTYLEKTNFTSSNLANAKFDGCDFGNEGDVVFTDATFVKTCPRKLYPHAELSGAKFTDCELEIARNNRGLEGVQFTNCNLNIVTGSGMEKCRFVDTTVAGKATGDICIKNCSFKGGNLSEFYMCFCYFGGCEFVKTNIERGRSADATFEDCKFKYCNLYKLNPNQIRLKRCAFTSTNCMWWNWGGWAVWSIVACTFKNCRTDGFKAKIVDDRIDNYHF